MKLEIKYIVDGKLFCNESKYLSFKIIDPLHIKVIPNTKISFISAKLFLNYNHKSSLFCNGFQTWTDSGVYKINQRTLKRTLFAKIIDPFIKTSVVGDYTFCKQDKLVSHTLTYLSNNGEYLLYGDLNERLGFCSFHFLDELEIDKDIFGLETSEEIDIFNIFACRSDDLNICLDQFFDKLNIHNKVKVMTGYTSWYKHYQNIDEQKLLNDLKSYVEQKYFSPSLFQIDDGYEQFVGDWLLVDKKKFPFGLKFLVDKIKENNLIPGIWLAPFVVEKKSNIYQTHPEWILCKGALNWSGMYHLDLTNNEVKDYLHKVFTYYKELGFNFFKLDFLYAAFTKPRHGKTRAMLMYEAMDFLRSELKDELILGCGVPLGSAFGKVDYCRIGTDVTLNYNGPWYMRILHRERLSTKNAIKDAESRSILDQRAFGNDPDVFILRKTKLSEEQKIKLFKTNVKYGSLLLSSDNINEYNEDSINLVSTLDEIVKDKNERLFSKKL